MVVEGKWSGSGVELEGGGCRGGCRRDTVVNGLCFQTLLMYPQIFSLWWKKQMAGDCNILLNICEWNRTRNWGRVYIRGYGKEVETKGRKWTEWKGDKNCGEERVEEWVRGICSGVGRRGRKVERVWIREEKESKHGGGDFKGDHSLRWKYRSSKNK